MSKVLGSPNSAITRKRLPRDPVITVNVEDEVSGDSGLLDDGIDDFEGAKKSLEHVLRSWSLTCFVGYFVAVSVLILTFLICWNFVWVLPKPLPNDSPAHLFSEGRAWAHLEQLQQFGPSLVGTKSNVAVSDYIEGAVRSLQAQVEQMVTSGQLKYAPMLEIELQRPSGALNFELVGYTLTNHYTRLHNVIAKLSWNHHFQNSSTSQKASQPKALLVNSHFDSGVGSPGAMDARACNAVMLELARSVAFAENPLPHPIIFLWNGAEESLQEGSHGFITQHRWKGDIGSVLNFDAGGIGGPQILFQVGSGEYAELFASVAPRLHGSILAQELFDTGLLQGDTDYRIFRDFGDVHGLDLAWYRDGYKYHTPRDDLGWVEEGSLQHAGDNAFAYISAICSNTTKGKIWRDEFIKPDEAKGEKAKIGETPDLLDAYPSRSQIIFYDYLGFVTFHYSKTMAMVFNMIVVPSVGYCLYLALPLYDIGSATISIFGANLFGGICVLLVAGWMTLTGKVLSWFSNQIVMGILYIPPLIIGWLIVHYWRTGQSLKTLVWNPKSSLHGQNGKHSKSNAFPLTDAHVAISTRKTKTWQQLEYESIHGVAAWASSTLFVWGLLGIGSGYFWLWISLCALAAMIVVRHFGLSHSVAVERDVSMVPIGAYLCFLPGLAMNYQVMIQVMALAFPLSGRLPPDVPVEFVIGTIFTMLLINAITPAQPLLHRFHKYRGAFKLLLVAIFIGIIIGSMSFPYTPYRPKRVTIQHSMRTSPFPGHPGLDSPAILFAVCDAGPTGNMIDRLTELDSRGASPHRDVHDWDSVFPLSSFLRGYSLPSTAPALRPPTATVLQDIWSPEKQERFLIIEVDYSGSEWSTLKFLGPLKKWNLTNEIPQPSMPSGYHIIRHIGEHSLTKWAVELTFGENKPRRFDITATHFATTPMTQLVSQALPDWTAPLILATSMSHIDV
jgi:hypothetical protein